MVLIAGGLDAFVVILMDTISHLKKNIFYLKGKKE